MNLIGEGSFSKTFLIKNIYTAEKLVLKKVYLHNIEKSQRYKIYNEIQILK